MGAHDIVCASCGRSSAGAQSAPPEPAVAPPVEIVPEAERDKSGKGFALASLILGISSFAVCCCCSVTSVLAVVFSVLALRKMRGRPNAPGKGMAIAGLILGIAGFLIFLVSSLGNARMNLSDWQNPSYWQDRIEEYQLF